MKAIAKLSSYSMLMKGLEKTFERTLHSLTLDLENAVGLYSPASAAPYAQATFKAFILGATQGSSEQVKQAKQTTSALKEGANAVKTVARTPMKVIKAMSPQVISEAASALCTQTDRLVGQTVGYGTTALTARKIRELGLEEIQLFDDSQLKIDLDLRAMTSTLPETTRHAFGFLSEFVDVDEILGKAFNTVGKQAAQRMAEMVATIVQKRIVAAGKEEYSLKDLMGREIPMSTLGKARESLASWWNPPS